MEAFALAERSVALTKPPAAAGPGFATFECALPLPPLASAGAALLAAAGYPGLPRAEDEPRIAAALRGICETGQDWVEVEYRLRDSETWLLTRLAARRDAAGHAIAITGLHLDISARRIDAALVEMVSRELAHRLGNVFSVVASMLNLSLRGTPEVESHADELAERLAALASAYRLLERRADTPDSVPRSVALGALLAELLAPFEGGVAMRLDAGVAEIALSERAATGLALIVHELATNAAKHGALLRGEGSVLLEGLARPGGALLRWQESRPGAAVRAPQGSGFGSTLFDRLSLDLFGTPMRRDWRPEGLVAELLLPFDRLAPG